MKGKPAAASRVDPYERLRRLDGTHALRAAVPRGFVDYEARRRRDAEVVFFNFALAREMGLIPADHPDRLVPNLDRALRAAFALNIINEHDRKSGLAVPRSERLSGAYMATRYLQMQHPNRRGTTSGDGRSVWLGSAAAFGTTWDVSACGTGSTRLCPATAWTGRHYKTGSRAASYGCGTASVYEGLVAALMSESFHRNGIATERVLAVLGLEDGFGITVRAYPSLLRPAHFLLWLKQRDIDSLRGVAELFWERQRANGVFPALDGGSRWEFLAEWVARAFARAAAVFESEYVFCWIEWDGDNVLMDGAVLDYGSVRQFGLYHREYRYDDGPRFSTTIPEQRRKARGIAMAFAQIRDALIDGRPRALASYRNDPAALVFDREFEVHRARLLLRNVGFDDGTAAALLATRPSLVERFRLEHRYFEHASSRRTRTVSDGITRNAIYSTRDLLRELPSRYLRDERTLEPREFLKLAASSYAARAHRRATPARRRRAHAFQEAYLGLLRAAARANATTTRLMLREVAARAVVINRFARITGDAAVVAATRLARERRRLDPESLYAVIRSFVEDHATIPPSPGSSRPAVPRDPRARRLVQALTERAGAYRHGL